MTLDQPVAAPLSAESQSRVGPATGRPRASLIIPTFNRCALLAGAIASVAGLEMDDPRDLEVIIVDNASTDATRATVEKAAAAFPFALIYATETRQGVSFARNTGIARASGDVLIFMDDDQEIDPVYVRVALATLATHRADAVGGWLGYKGVEDFPAWLQTVILRTGQRDLGPEIRQLTASEGRLAGGNMAVTRAALERIGGFRTDIGRVKDAGKDGEDLELQERLFAAGGTIIYDPRLKQHHCLEPERMRRSYYLARSFHAGRGEYRMTHAAWTGARKAFGVPLTLVSLAGRAARSALSPNRKDERDGGRFSALCEVTAFCGAMVEAFTSRHEGRALSLPALSSKDKAARVVAALARGYFQRVPGTFGKRWLWDKLVAPQIAWRKLTFEAAAAFGAKFELCLPDLIQTHIYFFGVWEPLITRYIARSLAPGDTFVDVGANIGYHSLLAASRVGAGGQVFAVEASPSIHTTLKANIARNNVNTVHTFNLAAGAAAGEISIYLDAGGNLGASTTLVSVAGNRGAAVEAVIPMKTLPAIVGHGRLCAARMIKIDVEGAEWQVVRGMADILPAMSERTEILVEINCAALKEQDVTPEAFVDVFRQAGFQPYAIANEYNPEFYIDPPDLKLTPLTRFDFAQVDVVFRKMPPRES